jgi:hypothetical protein
MRDHMAEVKRYKQMCLERRPKKKELREQGVKKFLCPSVRNAPKGKNLGVRK